MIRPWIAVIVPALKFFVVLIFFTTHSKLRKVLFLALSDFFVCFLVVNQISLERLNGFAPNSQGRRVWSSLGQVK